MIDTATMLRDLRLEDEAARLLAFGRGAVHPEGGFGWLDDAGRLDLGRPVATWITARMTHCFALAYLRGDASAAEVADHGVRALTGALRDPDHGGWHSAVLHGRPVTTVKEGYAHAFVVLAAASAYAAGVPDAGRLLDDALAVMDERFWREDDGMVVDVWSADWSELDPYRGVNANMHAVEAFLAASDVTGDLRWRDRATRILTRVVDRVARAHDWRLPEHFDVAWQPQPDYNIDEPRHPFRPYGVTIGHLIEWSRLALHLRTALGDDAPGWLPDAAEHLYGAAVRRGWAVDGADGFVYTTDFTDRPVVRERMHWVVAEAIAAAWTLHRDLDDTFQGLARSATLIIRAGGVADARQGTHPAFAPAPGQRGAERRSLARPLGMRHLGGEEYARQFGRWWEYAEAHLVDREHGSWHHELDAGNRPSATIWQGKPDIYHAYQATILPLLPPAASFVGALRGRERP